MSAEKAQASFEEHVGPEILSAIKERAQPGATLCGFPVLEEQLLEPEADHAMDATEPLELFGTYPKFSRVRIPIEVELLAADGAGNSIVRIREKG